MPDDVRGPFLSNGYPGQVLTMDPNGSKRTVWTDAANLGAGGEPAPELPFEVLTANRIYYVELTGSNSNDGLTPLTPFATIEYAINAAGKLYLGKYRVDIKVGAGTWILSSELTLPNYNPGQINIPQSTLRPFNLLTDAGAILQYSGFDSGYSGANILAVNGAWRVAGFTLRLGLGQLGIALGTEADLSLGTTIFENIADAGSGPSTAIGGNGGRIFGSSGQTFNGPRWQAVFNFTSSRAEFWQTIQVNDTPVISEAFIVAKLRATVLMNTSNTGAATGVKFTAAELSIIEAIYGLPGDLPGTLTGGSIYNDSATPPVTMSAGRK